MARQGLVLEDPVFEDLVMIRSMWRLLSCTVIEQQKRRSSAMNFARIVPVPASP
jgi:hypothetical protein